MSIVILFHLEFILMFFYGNNGMDMLYFIAKFEFRKTNISNCIMEHCYLFSSLAKVSSDNL